jgi:hypothetical protein
MLDALVERVVTALNEEQSGGLSGDDSGLATVWAEFVDQVQGERSVFWRLYLDQVNRTIDQCLDGWGSNERAVAALATDGMTDWIGEHDEPITAVPGDALCREWVHGEVFDRVCSRAADVELDEKSPPSQSRSAETNLQSLNNRDLNQACADWLRETNQYLDPNYLFCLQLASWGMDRGVRVECPDRDRYCLQDQVNLLYAWKPQNVHAWLLSNPNASEYQEEEERALSESIELASSAEVAASILLGAIYSRHVADNPALQR